MSDKSNTDKLPAGALGVILAAAGFSARMKTGESKVLQTLDGVPVLQYSLDVFENMEVVGEIVLAAPDGLTNNFQELAKGFSKVRVVAGGQTRQESVARAASKLSPSSIYVAVHDGARPLLSADLVSRILKKAIEIGAAVPALPPAETVKEASDKNLVKATLDRTLLRLVQTPQIFQLTIFSSALTQARLDGIDYTDDSAMVEATGQPVAIVKGDPRNIKITYPGDMLVAEALLKRTQGRG